MAITGSFGGGGGGGGGSFGDPQPQQQPGLGVVGSGSGGGSQSQQTQQSQTFFSNPQLANQLAAILGGTAGQMAGQYGNFVANPTQHPYFQNAMQGIFQNPEMINAEQQAVQGLGDAFRSAGNMSSSMYGQAAQQQQQQFLQGKQAIAAQLLQTMFPQISQAMYQPISQIDDLMNALKLQESTGMGQSASTGKQDPQFNYGNSYGSYGMYRVL
jgi:hypothetical protein